jgi:hypothetical protein
MKGKTRLPEHFPVTAEMRAYTDLRCPTLDIDYYHEEFVDHWMGNGKMMVSWDATWRNWMRRTDRGAGPGMYGPEDRSIVRKRPKAVPQAEMKLKPLSDAEIYWQRMDEKRDQAVTLGLTAYEARRLTEPEINKFINDKECENGRNKADNI